VLFFISLATRRIEYVACTSNPDAPWVSQQARNLIMQLGDNRVGVEYSDSPRFEMECRHRSA